MRLVHGVGVVVAELVHDLGYSVVVALGKGIADGRLESVVRYISWLCPFIRMVLAVLTPMLQPSFCRRACRPTTAASWRPLWVFEGAGAFTLQPGPICLY